MELQLKKGDGFGEEFAFVSERQLLPQAAQALAEGQMLSKFHKADQVPAALAAVAVEHVPASVDIERRSRVGVQRAESHELFLSRSHTAGDPMAPSQVL